LLSASTTVTSKQSNYAKEGINLKDVEGGHVQDGSSSGSDDDFEDDVQGTSNPVKKDSSNKVVIGE